LGRTVKITAKLNTPIKRMIMSLLSSGKIERAEISLTFVGNTKIRNLNRDYLGKDRRTDVISFNLSGDETVGKKTSTDKIPPLVGDIYICVPRAVKQAAEYGLSTEEELFRLAAHGVLHLLGYDHENDTDSRRMNRLQERLVAEFRSGIFN
jgi:probable rRNA maturation factor